MFYAKSITLFSLAAGSAFAAPFHRVLQERATSGLNTAIVAAGKLYFGTATDNPELTNATYVTELNNTADFGQITPGNSMKWDAIEPERGTYTYTDGDVIADLAKGNGQKLRCHNLVWYNQLPSWVSSGGFDNATLIEILKNHITNEVTHYKGQCYAWDVVNEALSDAGDGSYRSNVFYETIGEAYIPIAFAAASAADPDAKLYYNDYGIESAGAKSTAAQDVVKMIQAYGAKIDGVGLQSHFIVGETPSTTVQVSNMKAFTALGVDVAITELDIRVATPETTADETQQATDYASTVKACMQVDGCVGITIWDWTDKYSWVPSTFSGEGAALPWDANLDKKVPVYDAILSAEGGSTTAASSSSAVSSSSSITTDAVVKTLSSTTTAAASGTLSTDGAGASSTSLSVAGALSGSTTRLSTTSATATSSQVSFSTFATVTSSSVTAALTTGSEPVPSGDCEVEYVYV
ncbi:hypothetical protein LTR36_007454 [Oleoguttula mirabilis]|uniref:Beta-xylanase n=1 Tax=Oleoguttula mirabilis TaxID=1507867 RepID=A0AAV9JA75_9PEZI|nr:hypothetical protein LTR36_007454 [Oleoguttula mirabilis]